MTDTIDEAVSAFSSALNSHEGKLKNHENRLNIHSEGFDTVLKEIDAISERIAALEAKPIDTPVEPSLPPSSYTPAAPPVLEWKTIETNAKFILANRSDEKLEISARGVEMKGHNENLDLRIYSHDPVDKNNPVGFRGASSGSAKNIRVRDCVVWDCKHDGLRFGRNYEGLVFDFLKVRDTGLVEKIVRGEKKPTHHAYFQCPDVILKGVEMSGYRDDNALSLRSSGQILGGEIDGKARQSGGRGAKYFGDHPAPKDGRFIVRDLEIYGSDVAVELKALKNEHRQVSYAEVINITSDANTPLLVSNDFDEVAQLETQNIRRV